MRVNYFLLVVEGTLDEVVSKKLIAHYAPKIEIGTTYPMGGRSQIKKKIGSYNQAAKVFPYLVLVDLDQDECAPILINDWLPNRHPQLLLRVAVRQVESWLLADRKALADFLSVVLNRIPMIPEAEPNSPELIMSISRQSRKKIIRESIPPIGDTAKRGPDYNGQLSRFVIKHWEPERARIHSPSLDKTIKTLQSL
jgi:hypothetical protein